jgi:hypothetical protein
MALYVDDISPEEHNSEAEQFNIHICKFKSWLAASAQSLSKIA